MKKVIDNYSGRDASEADYINSEGISKTDVRRYIKKLRNAIPQEYAKAAQDTIFSRITRLPEFNKRPYILSYVSYNSEISTLEFINGALSCNDRYVYVPRVEGSRVMNFYRIHDMDKDLVPGAYGIPEPAPGLSGVSQELYDAVSDEEAVIIIPGLAFDENRNRIGYGGGFYDTYLAGHPGMLKIAVAFDCQIIDRCPGVEATDIKPDIIVTEKRVIERR